MLGVACDWKPCLSYLLGDCFRVEKHIKSGISFLAYGVVGCGKMQCAKINRAHPPMSTFVGYLAISSI